MLSTINGRTRWRPLYRITWDIVAWECRRPNPVFARGFNYQEG